MAGLVRHGRITGRPAARSARAGGDVADLSLLEGFELRLNGSPIDLPLSAQRLVAFLALHDRPLQRSFVAGNLWLDTTEERASANLRSALWRLHRHGRKLVETNGGRLRLTPDLQVDFHQAAERARRVLIEAESPPPGDPLADAFDLALHGELLPDWYDDWILVERERFRQLRLHALETLSQRLTELGRHAEAIEAALTAVSMEPVRESAHRALIRAYLAEGNPAEAVRQFRTYQRLLADELGASPSPQIRELVALAGDGAETRAVTAP